MFALNGSVVILNIFYINFFNKGIFYHKFYKRYFKKPCTEHEIVY